MIPPANHPSFSDPLSSLLLFASTSYCLSPIRSLRSCYSPQQVIVFLRSALFAPAIRLNKLLSFSDPPSSLLLFPSTSYCLSPIRSLRSCYSPQQVIVFLRSALFAPAIPLNQLLSFSDPLSSLLLFASTSYCLSPICPLRSCYSPQPVIVFLRSALFAPAIRLNKLLSFSDPPSSLLLFPSTSYCLSPIRSLRSCYSPQQVIFTHLQSMLLSFSRCYCSGSSDMPVSHMHSAPFL